LEHISRLKLAGKRSLVEFTEHTGTRTLKQNNSLHKWLRELAEGLNSAGLDMRAVLKPGVDIPWTDYSAKEFLWRPVQQAMTGHESTADCSKTQYGDIYDAIARHLGSKFGFQVPPWPQEDQR